MSKGYYNVGYCAIMALFFTRRFMSQLWETGLLCMENVIKRLEKYRPLKYQLTISATISKRPNW